MAADDGDNVLSVYISQLDLALAHIDCVDQLAAVRNVLEVNGVKVTDQKPEPPKEPKNGIWPW